MFLIALLISMSVDKIDCQGYGCQHTHTTHLKFFFKYIDRNKNGFSSTNCDFALPRGTTQGRGYGGGGGEWDRVSCA